MSADTDEACIRALGESGRWQLRGFLLVALVKVPAAWHMASILFTAPSPGQFRCASPIDNQELSETTNTSAVSVNTDMSISTHYRIYSSSLALQHLSFCFGFLHYRCQFYSLQPPFSISSLPGSSSNPIHHPSISV